MKQQKINKIEHRIHLHPQSQHYHHHHRHPLQRLHPPKPQYPDRRLHGRSRRKHMLEPNITGIKAILPGNFRDIFRIREFDIHALHTLATLQPNQTKPNQPNKKKHTLYKAAPCCAVSITWIVAWSPIFTSTSAGNGTCGRHTVPGYGSLVGPEMANGFTTGWLMLGGTVPRPMLM